MSKYGIQFKSAAIEKSDAAVPDIILARMNELKMLGCEVIIYVLNQVGDDIYHAIKFFGNIKLGKLSSFQFIIDICFSVGIVTQCTCFDKLAANREPKKMDMYIQVSFFGSSQVVYSSVVLKNLVQKFNAKLGGVNQLVSLMRALTSPSIRSDVFMFFGIDCTHVTCSRERPSIAAVIGSKDSTSSSFLSK